MGLVLEHVKELKSGRWIYRRRVPKDAADFISKREFKKVLGATRSEALRNYLSFHNEVESQIAAAQRLVTKQDAAQSGNLGGLALREVVEKRVAQLLSGSVDTDAIRDIVADHILESFPRGPAHGNTEGEPVGVPEVDRLTVELLRNPSAARPAPTLQDACELYLRDKLDPSNEEEHRKATIHLERVMKLVREALGDLPALATLRREDARKVRDHMLAQRKKNGQRISPASVQCNLTIVRSVVNHALRELDLRGTVANPFAELPVKGAEGGRGNQTAGSDKRLPLPPNVLKKVRSQVIEGANRELGLIWRMLEGTGCRLA